MDILQAKQLVIDAGVKLVKTGLIARTWGNVSCRVDEESFVITPSGKPYLGLTPDDIVEVRISDLAYKGDVKPSSEKGVHAEVYKAHPEANFVIHTHQKNASVISALKKGIPFVSGEAANIIGVEIPIASYGLPGTGKLKKGVAAALAAYDSKAVIMAHHGAVCFGVDSDDAFNVANTLEKVCEEYILEAAAGKLKIYTDNLASFCSAMPKILGAEDDCAAPVAPVSSSCDRENGKISFTDSADPEYSASVELATGKTCEGEPPVQAELHRDIYTNRKEINYIIENTDPAVVAVSALGKALKPMVDDFAQIVGPKVKNATAATCAKALKKRNAVLLKGTGALCCGAVESDAEAVDMIMSKNCLAYLGASVFGKPKPIGAVDSHLMRFVYLKKYSKKASE